MAIYITGDTHGDFQRFGSKYFPQQKEMSREDYVVIAGDFGGLWDGSQKDQYWLDWLNKKSNREGNLFTVLGRAADAVGEDMSKSAANFVRDAVSSTMVVALAPLSAVLLIL